ncbi:hypothetical protein [Snodgrassella alvi]|jgi:hypothetical protein|uniref:Uncharacterized protein n=1 Tax=Snodgrassella alvi TaxID=1196083 RepID=A0A855FZN7_9NEIS|nr:hypothetical protein [Snodgrassella alvi]PIT11756.1 hypothetical protein BGI30_05720 [Snodgrassella alvi]PIT27743.1 hypothetical protein BGI37_02940 [Snodgrassella alvi]PIT57865.1 hypothetical protein BHC59_03070 [Snodgrassella alvi]PIT62626.1 hypothetical protein BHC57_00880 [Snodgrassella alvi]
MISVFGSLMLALWLLLTMNRSRQIFFEASIFIIVMMGVSCIIEHAWPNVNNAWLVEWIVQWIYIFIIMWLFDIVCLSSVSAVIYSIIVGVAYYYLQLNVSTLVGHWLK